MRNLRHFPPGSLVEVTTRTVQGRRLMVPSQLLNQIIVGVLGRAQDRYPVRIHAYAFASNHYHLTLTVDDARQLAQFMGYVNSNLGREIGRLTGWKDKIWSRRYQAIPISNEEDAQVARLKYVLAHGAKEGLVASPQEWPGVHCVHPLLTGEWTVQGTWYDRRREYALRRGGKEAALDDYTSQETLTLTPPALLEGLVSGAIPPAHREPGRRDHWRGGTSESADGSHAARRGRGLPPEPGDPPQEDEEVGGSAFPCLPQEGPPGALRGLCNLRRGLPRGRRPSTVRGKDLSFPDR